MSRAITFSRVFPAYHPNKGQKTYFPEMIFNSLHRAAGVYFTNSYSLSDLNSGKEKETEAFWQTVQINYDGFGFKGHTIRSGTRWKVGDKFSPRVWSGKPYASKMITIAPDIEIRKIWDIKIEEDDFWIYNNKNSRYFLSDQEIAYLAHNDGLSVNDFCNWFRFPKPFTGQIVCWDESIYY